MARTTNIILEEESSYALHHQVKLGQYDFPFTINPTIGCFFGCTYCYSPWVAYGWNPDRKKRFFENIHVKLDKPQHLANELPKYSVLPQHMKRVQINETSEYYLPQVLHSLRQNGKPDLMLGILDAFHQEWSKGNKWMLHILTKSDLILTQIDKLKEMKQMVQIEVSFANQDDTISRSIEFFTPTVTKRLELVEELAKAGLFVRVMAMPFYGERKDLLVLKDETFKRGAKAFKNKGLNYYSWDDLAKSRTWDKYLDEKIPRSKGRLDTKDESLIVKSGEYVLVNGRARRKTVSMPRMDEEFIAKSDWSALTKKRWRFTKRSMKVIDCGYRDCNDVDWGYIT